MKNHFKKFSIMFVMLLVLMLGCCTSAFADDSFVVGKNNLNNTTENSAKVGVALTAPEKGWNRYDDSSSYIQCNGPGWFTTTFYQSYYKNYLQGSCDPNASISFKFIGSKLRIIDISTSNRTNNAVITIDEVEYPFNPKNPQGLSNPPVVNQSIVYEKLGLQNSTHIVKITRKQNNDSDNSYIGLDAIDTDGKLLPYVSIDKETLNLKVADSGILTASTTPQAVGVTWITDDPLIATVDSNGKVTAIAEGTCIIRATINDSNSISATCKVYVTKQSIPSNSGTTTVNPSGAITNSYGILNMSNPSGFTQNNNNGGNNNSSNNSGNTNNSGNSGNNYSNNNNSNSNNNYYYNNYYYYNGNKSA